MPSAPTLQPHQVQDESQAPLLRQGDHAVGYGTIGPDPDGPSAGEEAIPNPLELSQRKDVSNTALACLLAQHSSRLVRKHAISAHSE